MADFSNRAVPGGLANILVTQRIGVSEVRNRPIWLLKRSFVCDRYGDRQRLRVRACLRLFVFYLRRRRGLVADMHEKLEGVMTLYAIANVGK